LRSATVEAEPDDHEAAPPLSLERSCVWPTLGTTLDAGERTDCRIHSEHELHEFRESDRLSDYLRGHGTPDSA